MTEPGGEVILNRSDGGQSQVQLRVVGGTVWLTQAQMAELYATSLPNVVQIILRVLADGEVSEATISSELRIQSESKRRSGARVRSTTSTWSMPSATASLPHAPSRFGSGLQSGSRNTSGAAPSAMNGSAASDCSDELPRVAPSFGVGSDAPCRTERVSHERVEVPQGRRSVAACRELVRLLRTR